MWIKTDVNLSTSCNSSNTYTVAANSPTTVQIEIWCAITWVNVVPQGIRYFTMGVLGYRGALGLIRNLTAFHTLRNRITASRIICMNNMVALSG